MHELLHDIALCIVAAWALGVIAQFFKQPVREDRLFCFQRARSTAASLRDEIYPDGRDGIAAALREHQEGKQERSSGKLMRALRAVGRPRFGPA